MKKAIHLRVRETITALRPGAVVRRCGLLTAVALASLGAAGFGCDRDDGDDSAMIMQPSVDTAPTTAPATRPVAALPNSASDPATDPATQPAEDVPPPVAFIIIENERGELEPFEFPPAKLFLKRTSSGGIRAHLYSDDPPEAIKPGWRGDSFYFEMELALPRDMDLPRQGSVSPEELASAEWLFRSNTSERSDTPSGIFVGGERQLQPMDVAVSFEPLDENLVMVTLDGIFAEFDRQQPRERLPRRQVQVRAVLSAEAIRP